MLETNTGSEMHVREILVDHLWHDRVTVITRSVSSAEERVVRLPVGMGSTHESAVTSPGSRNTRQDTIQSNLLVKQKLRLRVCGGSGVDRCSRFVVGSVHDYTSCGNTSGRLVTTVLHHIRIN